MKRIALLVALVTFLAGCSSTRFMYNRLDFLLPWYIDDYAELNREQEAYLDERLEPFLAWHRVYELPCYLVLLDGVQRSLDREMTVQDIINISTDFEQAWYRTEEEALAWLIDLGGQLSDEQVTGFLEVLDERQLELEEKYLERTDEEFRQDSYDNMVDTAGDYLGRLQPQQRETMRAASEKLKRVDREWLRERAAFLARLEAVLQRQPGWEVELRDILATRDDYLTQEYLVAFEHNMRVLQALTVDTLNARTDKQDRHLRERLTDIRADLVALIEQGGGSAQECPADAGSQPAQITALTGS